jgi:hypothetical protein
MRLGRALDYLKVIDDFVGKHRDLRHLDLTDIDWDAISLVAGWLKDFRTATTLMSTTKRPVLSYTHTIFRGLQEDLRLAIHDLPRAITTTSRTNPRTIRGRLVRVCLFLGFLS